VFDCTIVLTVVIIAGLCPWPLIAQTFCIASSLNDASVRAFMVAIIRLKIFLFFGAQLLTSWLTSAARRASF